MEKSFLFTHEKLSKLAVPQSGRVEYHDTKQQKLRLRVTSSGVMSFAVVKKVNDKPKRVTIGRWPEVTIAKAREQAIEILDQLRTGTDPIAEKKKKKLESTKLSDVLEQYLLERDLKPYTVENYKYKLKLGFADWLDIPVLKISEEMILKRHKLLTSKGKTTANTTMRVLRLTLNYAVAVGMIEKNPTTILSKARMWHKNKRKDRLIPSNALADWHDAVMALDNTKAKTYLLMILYMGFRSSEALTLKWEYVDLYKRLITLPDTKNGSSHTLPIPEPVFSELSGLRAVSSDSEWVFPSTNELTPMSVPSKPIMAVIKASGVEFSPHDCRRTFATIAEAVNLPLTMIKRLMNHTTSNDVTGGYIITEEETLRAAVNKIADYIQARINSQSNVLMFSTNIKASQHKEAFAL